MSTACAAIRKNGVGRSLAPDRTEKALALGAIVMLLAVLAAIVRGYPLWATVTPLIWSHLVTIVVALALTPPLLLRTRGTASHRVIGTVWIGAMALTASLSLGIRTAGHVSPIHILSLITLAVVPFIWWSARTHRIIAHRSAVRLTVAGALLIAGFFTFPFHRLLGTWLFD